MSIKKLTKKITCDECKKKCCICSGFVLDSYGTHIIIPNNITHIYSEGIPLKRLKGGKWICEWFNIKTGKCKHYNLRPILCRAWFCSKHKKKTQFDRFRYNMPNSHFIMKFKSKDIGV